MTTHRSIGLRSFSRGGRVSWTTGKRSSQIALRQVELPLQRINGVKNVLALLVNGIAAVFFLIGPAALGYLFTSFFFSIGGAPLGARWIQEHFTIFPGQETNDYYGWLNHIQLNIGYHNEHHDFPSVPWNKLPDIKRIAPEAYDTLRYHPSWAGLAWRFVTDPSISLYTRQTRADRGDFRLMEELPEGMKGAGGATPEFAPVESAGPVSPVA